MPYVGEIRIFAGNFAPVGWMFCEGQILSISENETLFNLIGTTYGGDGQETFALPDLRGRIPMHMGDYRVDSILHQSYIIGETGGVEDVTLTINQIPAHNHIASGTTVIGNVFAHAQGARTGTSASPTTGYPTMIPGLKQYGDTRSTETTAPLVASVQTPPTGDGQPHSNVQPYLCVSFIISLFGVFPSPT